MGIIEIKAMQAAAAQKREDMIVTLALIVDKQQDMKKYQDTCDTERKELKTKTQNFENFQKNIRRDAFGIVALITFGVQGGGKLIEKIGAWLS